MANCKSHTPNFVFPFLQRRALTTILSANGVAYLAGRLSVVLAQILPDLSSLSRQLELATQSVSLLVIVVTVGYKLLSFFTEGAKQRRQKQISSALSELLRSQKENEVPDSTKQEILRRLRDKGETLTLSDVEEALDAARRDS